MTTKSAHAPRTTGKPFYSLKDVPLHEFLKAITVKPFELTSIAAVQEEVLSFLQGLTRPYDLESASSRDLVCACTGTGKALASPIIEARLKAIENVCRKRILNDGLLSKLHLAGQAAKIWARANAGAVFISPTRQLATQIANETLTLWYHHKGFELRLFVGEMSKRV